jgi:hypothetical protein
MGVGRSYARSGSGPILFSAIVPPGSFRRGANKVAAYRVDERPNPTLRLLGQIGGDRNSYTLQPSRRGGLIVPSKGRSIRIIPGAVDGFLDGVSAKGGAARFVGWAGDRKARRVRDRVLVFTNGRFVFAYSTPYSITVPGGRTDLGPGMSDAGFDFTLPRSALERGGAPHVRLFGVIGNRASELTYPADYPFAG